MAAVTAPKNPRKPVRADAAQVVVLLGPSDGSAPTMKNEVDWLIPQRIGVYANGGRDDVLTFEVDISLYGQRLMDTRIAVSFHRQVEVRVLDEDGNPDRVIAWGFLARQPQKINGREESESIEVRLDQHVFGVPLVQYPTWNRATSKIVYCNTPLIFNPEIDEIVEPNMSWRVRTQGDDPGDTGKPEPWAYVLDPESVRSTPAQVLHGGIPSLWTLARAVHLLCWQLNPSQTYIKNPTLAELQTVFADRNDLVKNVEIPFGSYLPAALDALLIPAEYGWHLVHTLNKTDPENPTRETRMRFYQRGQGVSKHFYMQRVGEQKTLEETNVEDLSMTYSIVDLANRVEVYGSEIKREGTFILSKGWDTADDGYALELLEKDQAAAVLKRYVGRKWVLNEAGDYTGRRAEIVSYYSLDAFFGFPCQIKRRPFEQCLSEHNNGDDTESNRYRVDWYDADATGAVNPANPADPGWTKVKWPYSVLEKEAGILFEGSTPPDSLWALISSGNAANARVRITATLRADKKISGIATRRAQSPNGLDVTMIIDLRRKFQKSLIDTSSIFPALPTSGRDDTTAIATYATEVRNIEDAALVGCSVTLEGIEHWAYQLGDLIDKIDGRNISLDGYTPQAGVSPRRPQIVGFNYLLAGVQKVEVLLESFKQEKPQLRQTKHK